MKLAPTLHLPSCSVEPPLGYPPIPPENEAGDRILNIPQSVGADCLLYLAEQDEALDRVSSRGQSIRNTHRPLRWGLEGLRAEQRKGRSDGKGGTTWHGKEGASW